MEKRNSNQQDYLHIKREKFTNFKKNLPPQNIVIQLMFLLLKIIAFLRIEYRLVVKPYFPEEIKNDAEFEK